MITNVLARMIISIGGIIVLLAYGAFVALVIIGLIRLVRYLGTAGKEQKLMRIEMGKLAEEVHLIRQKLENHVEGEDSGGFQ